jgi:hypothetical protein
MGNVFDSRRKFRQEMLTENDVVVEYRKLEATIMRLTQALTRP